MLPRFSCHYLEVLGREIVRDIERLVKSGLNHYSAIIFYGLLGDLFSGQQVKLHRSLLIRFAATFLLGVSRYARRFFVVLRLGQKVCRDIFRVAFSSAIISTSEGPAIMSMPTAPNTSLFAAATYALPGPVIMSTFGMLSVRTRAPLLPARRRS